MDCLETTTIDLKMFIFLMYAARRHVSTKLI